MMARRLGTWLTLTGLLLALVPGAALAARLVCTHRVVGTGIRLWQEPSTWDTGTVPGPTSVACTNGAGASVIIRGGATALQLQVELTDLVQLQSTDAGSASLTLGDLLDVRGRFSLAAASGADAPPTLMVGGNVFVESLETIDQAGVASPVLDAGGDVVVNSGFANAGLVLRAATFEVPTGGSLELREIVSVDTSRTIVNGRLRVTSGLLASFTGPIDVTGELSMSGATTGDISVAPNGMLQVAPLQARNVSIAGRALFPPNGQVLMDDLHVAATGMVGGLYDGFFGDGSRIDVGMATFDPDSTAVLQVFGVDDLAAPFSHRLIAGQTTGQPRLEIYIDNVLVTDHNLRAEVDGDGLLITNEATAPLPDLVLDHSFGATPNLGEAVPVIVAINNAGAAPYDTTITATIDLGPGLVTGQPFPAAVSTDAWACTAFQPPGGTEQVTCQLEGGLPAGGGTSFVITPTVTRDLFDPGLAEPGVATSTATASGASQETTLDNNSDHAASPATAPDLTLTIEPSTTTPALGDDLTFVVPVTNVGDGSTSAPVSVVLDIDPGLELTALTTSHGQCDVVQRTCAFDGPLSPTEIRQLGGTLSTTAEGTTGVTATVVHGDGTVEVVTDDNSAHVDVDVTTTPLPDLVVDFELDPLGIPHLLPGERYAATLTVTNAGPGDFAGAFTAEVVLTPLLVFDPPVANGMECTYSWFPELGQLTCEFDGTLTPGQEVSVSAEGVIELHADSVPEEPNGFATVSTDVEEVDKANNVDQDTVALVGRPDITVQQAVAPLPAPRGGTTTATIDITNAAATPTAGPITLTLDPGLGLSVLHITAPDVPVLCSDILLTCEIPDPVDPDATIRLVVTLGVAVDAPAQSTLTTTAFQGDPVAELTPEDNTVTTPIPTTNPDVEHECRGRPATLWGTDGPDVLVGTAGPDVIQAYGGDDRIMGLAGDDVICAGPGADVVDAGTGADTVYGEGGPDRVFGRAGQDTLHGGPGDDLLDGGSEHDVLWGDDGHDLLRGADHDDELHGGEGNDKLFGDYAGFFRPGRPSVPGDDTLDGGPGDDRLWAVDGSDELLGGPGDDRMDCGGTSDPADSCTADGGPGNDRISGSFRDDTLGGGAGDDRIFGDYGADAITGGDGHDWLHGGGGDDRIEGGAGDDFLYGEALEDTLDGGPGRDWIDGGGANDTIYGGPGDDTITGGSWDDTILAGDGDDFIDGGTHSDHIDGGDGEDVCINARDERGVVQCEHDTIPRGYWSQRPRRWPRPR